MNRLLRCERNNLPAVLICPQALDAGAECFGRAGAGLQPLCKWKNSGVGKQSLLIEKLAGCIMSDFLPLQREDVGKCLVLPSG